MRLPAAARGRYLIHKNQAAKEYVFGIASMSSTGVGTRALYSIEESGANAIEGWGNTPVSGSMGIFMSIYNVETSIPSYAGGCVTPWGSYTIPLTAGTLSTGYLYCVMTGTTLTVDAACNWTLSFTALNVYCSVGTNPVLTIGPQTMSGSGYDERLNYTQLSPILNVSATYTPTCDQPVVSNNDSSNCTGGYKYGPTGGPYTQDSVLIDTTSPGGSCVCLDTLPSIGGSTSYGVSCTDSVANTASATTTIVFDCPAGCPIPTVTCCYAYATGEQKFTGCYVKDKNVSVGSQNIATAWNCQIGSGSTSGSSSVSSSPAYTTCESVRRMTNVTQCHSNCSAIPVCPPWVAPCVPTPCAQKCIWTASSTLTWPTLPPCVPGAFNLVDYDVSLPFTHGRLTYNTGTSTMWTGYAPNGNPYAWADLDSGLNIQSATTRWQDHNNSPLGILYDAGGGNLNWLQTLNEGNSFTSPMTIASGLATGGFFDFEECSDFSRVFMWEEGASAPYTLYFKVLDAQLNVIVPRTITNVTNADKASIRIKEYPISGGGKAYGLLYSVSGVLTFLTSKDWANWS